MSNQGQGQFGRTCKGIVGKICSQQRIHLDRQIKYQTLRNNENMNLGSTNQGQGSNFLQQAGEGMKTMVQGAATVAQGAVQGATNIAQGAADGATNIAHGAATAVKSNLGSNPDSSTTAAAAARPGNPATRI